MAENGAKKGDLILLACLAQGFTIREAARQAGIGERTAFRRLQEPQFRKRLDALRADTVERTAAILVSAGVKACATLVKLLDARSEMARLGAARTILEMGAKWRETIELERRVGELEAARNNDGLRQLNTR